MFSIRYHDRDVVLGKWMCSHTDAQWSEPEQASCFEMVVPIRGHFVRSLRGEERIADPDSVLFANAGDTYRVRHTPGVPDECAVVLLSDRGVEDLSATCGRRSLVEMAALTGGAVPLSPAGSLLVRRLGDITLRNPDRLQVPAAIGHAVAAILAPGRRTLAALPPGRAGRARQHAAVLRALEFVAAHFRAPVTLAGVAAEAGYSPFHFARMFRRHMGVSVYRHVTRLRLREAVRGILAGEENLTLLALRLGFSSHSHFTASFKAEYGHPPSMLRTRAR